MFEPVPEFASDLEWMLQSNQVSRELILEAMIEEYYLDVHYLALTILDDEAAARKATNQAFSNALVSIHTFKGQTSVDLWFYPIVLKTCQRAFSRLQSWRALKAMLPLRRRDTDFGDSRPQTELDAALWLAIDDLDEPSRLLILLLHAHNWDTEKISAILDIPGEELQTAKGQIEDKLRAGLENAAIPEVPAKLDELVKSSLKRRWVRSNASQIEVGSIFQSVLGRTARGSARLHGFSYLKELLVVVILILVAVGSIWAANAIWPEDATRNNLPTVEVTRIVNVDVYPTSTKPDGDEITATLEETALPTPVPKDALYTVLPGDSLDRIASQFQTSPMEIRELNRLPDGGEIYAGQRLLIPGRLLLNPGRAATPVPSIPQVAPLKDPLSSEDILHRIEMAGLLYHTLWLDAQIIDYGPMGYIGPPKVERAQVWLGQDQALALIGSASEVQIALLRQGGKIYLAKPGENQPWFFEWQYEGLKDNELIANLTMLLDTLHYGSKPSSGMSFKATDREIQAGREALVVDEIDKSGQRLSHFWMDDRTGLTLRKIYYLADAPEIPKLEIEVKSIEYDIDFPQDLLDERQPWRGGFAQDYTGIPILTTVDAWTEPKGRDSSSIHYSPGDSDPLKGRLTFNYLGNSLTSGMELGIYTESTRLDAVIFSDPWTMICQRSADGTKIAYVPDPNDNSSQFDSLYWLDLNANRPNQPFLSLAVTHFAFAPDGRRLAVFGKTSPGEPGILILLDTESGDKRVLLTPGDASSLVWSPDGERLALMVRYQVDSFEDYVVVINTYSGVIEYSESIDYARRPGNPWPMNEWGVQFPVEMGGLETCALPPEAMQNP
jgi:DNA-directed RNA polymerase specialized sigma24 family protein/LysM repeat protein